MLRITKLRISSTGGTLWKQLVRVVIKLIKVSKNFIHINWRINKKEIEEADSKDSEDKSKEEKEECEKKEKQSSSQSCGEKVPRGRIISIKNITNDELEVIKEEQPKKKVDDELEIKEEPKTIEESSSEE